MAPSLRVMVCFELPSEPQSCPALLASAVTTSMPPLTVVLPIWFQLLRVTVALPFLVSVPPPTMLSPLTVYDFVSLLNVTDLGLTAPLIVTVVTEASSLKMMSSPSAEQSSTPPAKKFMDTACCHVALPEAPFQTTSPGWRMVSMTSTSLPSSCFSDDFTLVGRPSILILATVPVISAIVPRT